MILSDREIQAAMARKALKITPRPSDEAWSSTAVDLRLAKELVLWKRPGGAGVEAVVCPNRDDYNFDIVRNTYSEQIEIPSDGYVFRSGTPFFWAGRLKRFNFPINQDLRLAWKVKAVWHGWESAFTSPRPRFTPALDTSRMENILVVHCN